MKTKKTNRLILFILILFLLIVQIAYAKVPEIVLKQKEAVVSIYVNNKDGKQIATGSGFIVDPDGIIATNYHVVKIWIENTGTTILFKMENGAFLPIDHEAILDSLISNDKDNDIAILKVAGKGLPAVKLATNYKPNQGEEIFVIGSPMGLETSVSNGIISSVREKAEFIQITAPVSPGSSGSPVFNSKGEVIGVATFLIEGGQNLNFAIPIKHVENLIEKAKKGEFKKGRYIFEPPLPSPDPGKKRYDEAMSDYNAGRYKEAIEKFENFTIEFPRHVLAPEAFLRLVDLYQKEGEDDKLSDSYLFLQAVFPTYSKIPPTILLEMGKSAMQVGDGKFEIYGLKTFKRLIKQYPDSLEALIAKDIISQKKWFSVGEYKGAINFIDTKSITRINKDTVRVLRKIVPSKGSEIYSSIQNDLKSFKIEGWKDYSYTIYLDEMDCIERRSSALQIIFYNNDGRMLDIVNAPAKKWSYISPGSSDNLILEFVCEED